MRGAFFVEPIGVNEARAAGLPQFAIRNFA
jgi:hypothetical protein